MGQLNLHPWRVLCSRVFAYFPFLFLPLLMSSVLLCAAEGKQYSDVGNGTVRDEHLVKFWSKNDSFKDTKRWMNHEGARAYARRKNKERLGGFADWRLPLKGEIKSLYNRKIKGRPTYDVSDTFHVDDVFDLSYCYFWTKEEIDSKFAWQVSLCNGKVYKSGKKNGPGNSVLLIRP